MASPLAKNHILFQKLNMPFNTYILHCNGGYFYTGHTDNLEQRLSQHESGVTPGFASDHRPFELVWNQEFPSRYEALAAERKIKGWSRAKKMALIRGDWDLISRLAKGANNANPAVRPEPVEGLPFSSNTTTKGKDNPSTSSGRTEGETAAEFLKRRAGNTMPDDMLPFLKNAKNEPPPPGDEI